MATDPRVNPIIGDLNSLRDTTETPQFDQSNVNTMAPVHEAMERALAPNIQLEFPLRAICLYAKKVPLSEEYVGGWNLREFLGLDPYRVMVYARIPELHASIPFPDVSKITEGGNLSSMDPVQKQLMSQHHVFYGNQLNDQQKGYMAGSTQIPQVGDTILVDFRDRTNFVDGIFIGIEQAGNGSIQDPNPESVAPFVNASGPAIFAGFGDASAPTEGGVSVLPEELEALCPGPLITSPAFPDNPVESVLIDGVPVAVTDSRGNPIAEYFLAMYNAAKNEGIRMAVTSAFRADANIDTREAAAACGIPGYGGIRSGQYKLWLKNCPISGQDPKNYGRWTECSPGTSRPGSSKGGHRSGYAIDLNFTNPGGGYSGKAAPQPTKTYKWLMDNAHKYGFIRTVFNERWHWEYHGAGANRFKVRANHWSWDNYFTSGEGVGTI
tara:strand:+ start:1754 stop:3067 length:1314 start_codon:yes stop_codon:yes gene_type:complete